MKHATKYRIKTIIASLFFFGGFLMLPHVGINKGSLQLGALLALAVFWIVWPSVWNSSESTKSEIVSYNCFGILVIAVGFAFEYFAS